MDRLEQLRQVIDDIVHKNRDLEESRCGFVHLYGVSATCTILALKRGLNPELCSSAGMLHDIWNYADVFQHYLYNPSMFVETAAQHASVSSSGKAMRIQRLEGVLSELGI